MKKRILWIEDDAMMLNALLLEIKKKYDIDKAYSYEESINLLQNHKYTLILLDLLIPCVSENLSESQLRTGTPYGLVLLRSMRSSLRIYCPVIVITVMTGDTLLKELKKLNAVYLRKGMITPADLRSIIDEEIKRARRY